MQVFRLIKGGEVDRIIAFDSLPKRLLSNIKTKAFDGFPRYWLTWAKENGSVQEFVRLVDKDGHKEVVNRPFSYILDYKMSNQDKESWEAIGAYTRRVVDLKVRLKDKLEDMAAPLAKDSYSELSLEPEDVPVIPIPMELVEKDDEPVEIITTENVKDVPKKRGRPKKEMVVA